MNNSLTYTVSENVTNRRSQTREVLIQELKNVLRPSFQREPASHHVEQIKQDLLNEKAKYGSIEPMGVLVIGNCQNQRYIIDGQHRLQAYTELNEPSFVVIQEWTFKTFDDMNDHFIRLNQHVPVEEYVLVPKTMIIKAACDKLVNYLEREYIHFLSKSLHPNFPNINLQNFKSLLHLFPGYETFKEETIIEQFEAFNAQCRDQLLKSRNKEDRTRAGKVDVIVREKNLRRGLFINRALINLAHKQVEAKEGKL